MFDSCYVTYLCAVYDTRVADPYEDDRFNKIPKQALATVEASPKMHAHVSKPKRGSKNERPNQLQIDIQMLQHWPPFNKNLWMDSIATLWH